MSDQTVQGFTGGQMLLAVLGGAAVGAGIALLTAPRSGAQTRAELMGVADRARAQAAGLPHAVAGAFEAGSEAFVKAMPRT